jgi:hypothetical protein
MDVQPGTGIGIPVLFVSGIPTQNNLQIFSHLSQVRSSPGYLQCKYLYSIATLASGRSPKYVAPTHCPSYRLLHQEEAVLPSTMSTGKGIDLPGIRTSPEGHFRKWGNRWESPGEPISPSAPRKTLALDTITYHLLGLPLSPLEFLPMVANLDIHPCQH